MFGACAPSPRARGEANVGSAEGARAIPLLPRDGVEEGAGDMAAPAAGWA
jgi:hypothetical protein